MPANLVKALCFVSMLVGLAGCEVVYRSPMIMAGVEDGTSVRVTRMTPTSVLQANQSPYRPRSLPAAFSRTAGTATSQPGIGALPDAVFQPDAPQTLPTRVPPAVDPGPYTIGVGDVVLLSTPGGRSSVEELSGLLAAQNSRQGYTVQDDGAINIPNVGRVRIADLTIEQAEDVLFQRLVESQIEPTFSLEIAEFNSRRVSIGGAVGRPGVLPITLRPLQLGDALATMGGVAAPNLEFASVRIYRDGTLYQIPVETLYQNGDLLNIRLIDGDAVFVDTGFELDQAQAFFQQQIILVQTRQQARANALAALNSEVAIRRGELEEARANFQARTELGAEDRDYVYLMGEVSNQTRLPLPYEQTATLADAIFGPAGGITSETGDVSQIYVLRASADPAEFGVVNAWHLDARNAANFTLMSQFELRPDDIIFVAQQPITRWNRAISQILPSVFSAANVASN